MIERWFRSLLARGLGPHCAYPELAAASVSACIAADFPHNKAGAPRATAARQTQSRGTSNEHDAE